jgi:plastocyanin
MPPDYIYDTYVFHWTAAVKGEDAYGTPVDADANQDGLITMDEAYIYAVEHDEDQESPQYGEYPEGTGSYLSLWVTSNPPAQPTKPVGPTLAVWHREYTYTSMTTEPDNEQIYYRFDWGDGNDSGWIGPYNSGQTGTASHTWTELGTYNVTVKARDINGAGSPTSEPLTVVVTDNTPPFDPTITGPAQIKPKVTETFTFNATDEFDHDVTFDIDWGDGNGASGLGPYHSGETFELTHTWARKGAYSIRAMATDSFGAESNWTYLEVVCPTDYQFSLEIFLQHLFERFPYMFPILRHLIDY